MTAIGALSVTSAVAAALAVLRQRRQSPPFTIAAVVAQEQRLMDRILERHGEKAKRISS